MARVGGRNAIAAWMVGIACVALVGALAFLALPLLPAATGWVGERVEGPSTAAPTPDPTSSEAVTECSDIYGEALWAALRGADGAVLSPSLDAPTTTATAIVTALQPQVTLTCTWTATAGTVTSTLATVATDAGAIAAAALPAAGFTCESASERVRCTRADGELTETIEAGGGRWLSSSESGWHPEDYAARVADAVWP